MLARLRFEIMYYLPIMERIMLIVAALVMYAIMNGCAISPAPSVAIQQPQAKVDVLVWSYNLAPFVNEWQEKAATKYGDCVMIFCHGGPGVDGAWTFYPDPWFPQGETVEEGVARVRKEFAGDRRIVLVCCNEAGSWLPPSSGKVSYARATVWLFRSRNRVVDINGLVDNP